jgi:hypothetical protein
MSKMEGKLHLSTNDSITRISKNIAKRYARIPFEFSTTIDQTLAMMQIEQVEAFSA